MTTAHVTEEIGRCHWSQCPHGADCIHALPYGEAPADPNCEYGFTTDDDGPDAW